MASAAIAAQDQSGDILMNTAFFGKNGVSLDAAACKEQTSSVDDPAPKMRKPYTITKQRERWTVEEHKKFLEALKLYGRAWRQIEEHVGSKTAVQIRSHAQKFFTKVSRESNGDNTSSGEPIEIPPPRPKRKPVHPYPRKLASPVKKGLSVPELPTRSPSPNLSISEQENHSPKSVLSVVGSDTLAFADSNSATGSIQIQDDQISKKIDFKESCAEEELKRSLKLFGRTLLVTDSDTQSSPPGGSSKSPPSVEYAHNMLQGAAPGAMYYMEFQNGIPNPKEVASTVAPPLPWWACYGGIAFPFVPFHVPESMKAYPGSDLRVDQNKVDLKEVSLSGSDDESVCEGGSGGDVETRSWQLSFDKEERELVPICQSRPSRKSASSERQTKGFVPYKRCLAEREKQSSTLTGEEREEQRIRLCL